MVSSLQLDDSLIEQALRIGGYATVEETVTAALIEYVERRKQTRIRDLFGHVDYARGYDYKKQRQRR
jgi:hypothetical protein